MRALLSVSDKTNIVEFAKKLESLGFEIISTGGTKKLLDKNAIKTTPIQEVTGNPESFDGRMKTISFQIGSSLLFDRDNQDHQKQAKDLNIEPIDLVCCNLYPFYETIKDENCTIKKAVENIDIGGPTMIRSAAKNYKYVTVVTDPSDYEIVSNELQEGGNTTIETRQMLSSKAFGMTADYDAMIDRYFSKQFLNNSKLHLKYEEGRSLRYGENWHQSANVYIDKRITEPNIPKSTQLAGKELSYNNYVDAAAALEAIRPLKSTSAVCIVKHNNPCGYATGKTLRIALENAWAGDSLSAFGSVIAMTQKVDLETVEFLHDKFVEIIVAPAFQKEAVDYIMKKSKNIRLLEVGDLNNGRPRKKVYKTIVGGILEQDRNMITNEKWEEVTKNKLPEDKKELALFSYESVKHIKSNAVVLSQEYEKGYFRTLAIGAGQPNRINSVKNLAIPKAVNNLREEGASEEEITETLQKCVLSSDAFFPFRDTVDAANEYSIKYIIQPGGSIKDKDSIKACNEHGIAMVFTGTRHFNH